MSDVIIGFITIIFIIAGILAIPFAIEQHYKHKAYLHDHCKKIGVMRGGTSMGVGMGSSGSTSIVPVFEGDKTGYLCDDGMQLWEE
jgi:hypothetical protein